MTLWKPLLPPLESQQRGKRTRFRIAATVVVAIILLVFARWVVTAQYREALATWNERQSSVADDRMRLVANWLRERRGDAEINSQSTQVIGLLADLARQVPVSPRQYAHLARL